MSTVIKHFDTKKEEYQTESIKNHNNYKLDTSFYNKSQKQRKSPDLETKYIDVSHYKDSRMRIKRIILIE